MKIRTVHYSALINLGNYNNEKIGFSAEISEDESVEEAIAELRQRVQNNASLNADKVRAMLYKGTDLIKELNAKIEKATSEWNRAAEFLRAQGIKPDAPDFPEIKLLLPEITGESTDADHAEIVDQDSPF